MNQAFGSSLVNSLITYKRMKSIRQRSQHTLDMKDESVIKAKSQQVKRMLEKVEFLFTYRFANFSYP